MERLADRNGGRGGSNSLLLDIVVDVVELLLVVVGLELPKTRNISVKVVLFLVAMDCASEVGRMRTE